MGNYNTIIPSIAGRKGGLLLKNIYYHAAFANYQCFTNFPYSHNPKV